MCGFDLFFFGFACVFITVRSTKTLEVEKSVFYNNLLSQTVKPARLEAAKNV
jgi:hypothetical protein